MAVVVVMVAIGASLLDGGSPSETCSPLLPAGILGGTAAQLNPRKRGIQQPTEASLAIGAWRALKQSVEARHVEMRTVMMKARRLIKLVLHFALARRFRSRR